jgi:hypothetical protein
MFEGVFCLGYWADGEVEQEAPAEPSAWRELWDQVLSGLAWSG